MVSDLHRISSFLILFKQICIAHVQQQVGPQYSFVLLPTVCCPPSPSFTLLCAATVPVRKNFGWRCVCWCCEQTSLFARHQAGAEDGNNELHGNCGWLANDFMLALVQSIGGKMDFAM